MIGTHRLAVALLLCAAWFAATDLWGQPAASAAVGPCSPSVATEQRYVVKRITLDSRFVLSPTPIRSQALLADAQEALKSQNRPSLASGEVFTAEGYFNLQQQLNAQLGKQLFGNGQGVLYIRPSLSSCDSSKKEIDVTYRCLSLSMSSQSYATTAFELPPLRFNRRDTTVSVSDAPMFSLTPYAGFNNARSLFGGVRIAQRFGATNWVRELAASADFSPISEVIDVAAVGERNAAGGLLSYMQWRLGYRYANLPANALRLRESTVLAQVFGATRPLSPAELLVRYGLSVEGGNRITNLNQANLNPNDLAQSGYGAAKAYVGSTANWHRHSAKLSYGLQLGNTGEGVRVGYLKHLLDAAYRGRFLVSDHRPLQLDAQVTLGQLQRVGGNVPIGERFFGGNVEREFIQGDAWRIRANPFIRSIPQNTFNGAAGGEPIGGDRFYAINLTVSQPIWRKPLMPAAIRNSADVGNALGGQLRTARTVLANDLANERHAQTGVPLGSLTNYSHAETVKLAVLLNDTTINVPALATTISGRIQEFRRFATDTLNRQNPALGADESLLLDKVDTYARLINLLLPILEDSADFDNSTRYDIEAIAVGYGSAIPAYITGVARGIQDAKNLFDSRGQKAAWDSLATFGEQLTVRQKHLVRALRKTAIPPAERAARPTIQYVGRTLGVLFNELTIAAVSPFVTLDAARLYLPERPIGSQLRYGVGGGIRLSLALVDVYVGYAANLNRLPGERSGAFLFGLDIINPF